MSVGEIIYEVSRPDFEEENEEQRMSFKDYIEEQEEHKIQKNQQKEALLMVDNKAALQIIQQDGGSWRTRHLRVRSAAIKDRVEKKEMKLVHTPGKIQLADLNTKSHPVVRLEELKEMWGIVKIPKAEVEEDVRVKTMKITEEMQKEGQEQEGYVSKVMKLMIVTIGSQLLVKALESLCKHRKGNPRPEEDESQSQRSERWIEPLIPSVICEWGTKKKAHANRKCRHVNRRKTQRRRLCSICERELTKNEG
jgi:hypothetical protein